MKEQELQGWDLALEGCISRNWRTQQDMYWKTYKTWKSSGWWTTELLQKLLGIAWDMWQHCKVLHEDASNWPLILKAELNHQVTSIYGLGHSVFASNKTILKHPLPELLQLPQAYKKHWLETVMIPKQWQEQEKARPYHQERQAMHIWLTTFNQSPIK